MVVLPRAHRANLVPELFRLERPDLTVRAVPPRGEEIRAGGVGRQKLNVFSLELPSDRLEEVVELISLRSLGTRARRPVESGTARRCAIKLHEIGRTVRGVHDRVSIPGIEKQIVVKTETI